MTLILILDIGKKTLVAVKFDKSAIFHWSRGSFLSVYFEHENIDYELIDNGIEGLEAVRKHPYDLVLLDMATPQFSGIEVIRSLKKDGIFELRNIVIFTASSDPRIPGHKLNNYACNRHTLEYPN